MTHPSKRKQPERKFVVQAVEYLNRVLPAGSFVTVIPAGHKDQRKNIGYRRGTPDILCIVPAGRNWDDATLLFEAKAKGKSATAEQRAVHASLEEAGAHAHVVRTLSDIEMALDYWNVPKRGRIAA